LLTSAARSSLIVDLAHPHEESMSGDTQNIDLQDCTKSTCSGPIQQDNKSTTTSVWAAFKKILTLSFSDISSRSKRAVADKIAKYEMKDAKQRLVDLVADKKVQDWIEGEVELGSTIYMTTGLQTATNQRVEHNGSHKLSENQGASIPDGNSGVEIGQSIGHERSDNGERSYSTPGERIFAIRARRVIVREATQAEHEVTTPAYGLAKKAIWAMSPDNRTSEEDALSEQLVIADLEDEDGDLGVE
jgi:hypothetical protein